MNAPQTKTPDKTPDGYMRNALGHLVPIEQVREQDLLRDQVARDLFAAAERIHEDLFAYKTKALADIDDVVRISAERYGAVLGGRKGNVTLTSYDGRIRIMRATAERITFTEELEAARALLSSCIDRWSAGANANLRNIVDRAFRTDAKGQIKMAAVLDLLRLDIDDEEWKRAMQAIRDSIQATGTAVYVRVQKRIEGTDQYVTLPLDLASV
ncbi:DUF3164 family protein [Azoarcus communis]|uniref:DUF3164 family protein n=1 Tax=Parazoarcus communis TaxID=41977 RepID=UPI0014591FF9|nr:DUF3164 family protein [Parazoarcus communis]NMG48964.1 DUF3164 family protein [Parazoarcus communis]